MKLFQILLVPKALLYAICKRFLLLGALAVYELDSQGASLKITSQKLSMLSLIRT